MSIAVTRTGDKTFTVVGDQTAIFHTGRRVKLTGTASVTYGTILSSTGTGPTTITLSTASTTIAADVQTVLYGIIGGEEAESSMPIHTHDGDEGSGGALPEHNHLGLETIDLGTKAVNTDLDISDDAYILIEPTDNITLTFINEEIGSTVIVELIGAGDYTITWAGATIAWDGGTAPDLAEGTEISLVSFIWDTASTAKGKLIWST